MRLVVADAATADMAEAAAWYERQERGLGEAFVAAVDVLLEEVIEHPMRFRVVRAATRRALVPRFPYCAFYRIEAEQVVVFAILHGRRDPRAWQERR